jgi:TolA-binding protein
MATTNFRNTILVLGVFALAFMAATVQANDADDRYAVAAGHYERHQWKLAVDEFQAFLAKYPADSRANQVEFFLGEAFSQQQKFDDARQRFQKYLAKEPEGKFARPALFRMGEAAYLANHAKDAQADLERFQTKYPDDKLNAFVLPYLGEIALSENDVVKAAALFRNAIQQFPAGHLQDDCRIGLAKSLEKQNQSEEAERLYAEVAAKQDSPLADDAQFYLGALQYSMGKHAQAMESFTAFEDRFSKSSWQPNARLGHGWLLLRQDQPDQALKMFQAVANDPKLGVEAGYWIGLAQKAKKDWATAAATLTALADANPAHELTPAIRFHAGDALLNAGDISAAIQQFDAVLALHAKEEWIQQAVQGKIQALLQNKDYDAVDLLAADFEKQFPQSEFKNDVRRFKARSLIERKKFDEAATILEPMVQVTPTPASPIQTSSVSASPVAALPTPASSSNAAVLENRYLLAISYDGLKRYDEALTMLQPVLASGNTPFQADAQLAQGSSLLALKRYAEATPPLEAFLAATPKGDAAVKGMGELAICYARTRQIDKAKRLLLELIARDAEHPLLMPTVEQLAEAAYDANDTAWSAELSARLSESNASNEYRFKGDLGLGWSQYKAGKLQEAADTFENVLKANPPEAIGAEAALVRGQILDQLGQSGSALAMYDQVCQQYPKSKQRCDALFAAARLHDKLNQHESAAVKYRQFATDYPESSNRDAALYEGAWMLQTIGKKDEAIQQFQTLHEAYPQSVFWADATYRLAQQAFEAKNFEQSASLANEVLHGKDERVREFASYLLGQIAVAKNDWSAARKAFETFIETYPNSSRRSAVAFWIAETFYRQSDWEAAGPRFEELGKQIETKQESWMAMVPLRRAQILAQKEQWDDAYSIASSIAEKYPRFEQQYEADYVIGRCLANRADFEGARQAYSKVIHASAGAKTETAAMAQWMIGESFFHQKKYDAALREYLRLEILYAYPTWQAAALLQAGKCYELLGDVKEASTLYQRIVTTYPDTPFTEQAQKKLQAASPPNTTSIKKNVRR